MNANSMAVRARTAILLGMLSALVGQSPGFAQNPPKAILLLQNRAGERFDAHLGVLNDLITARLTRIGLAVIDPALVIAKHRPSARSAGTTRAGTEAFTPDAVAGASALQLARLVDADYLVLAALTGVDRDERVFKGDGTFFRTGNKSTTITLRLALRMLAVADGAALVSDSVAAHDRIAGNPSGERIDTGTTNRLLEAAAERIAERVSAGIQSLPKPRATDPDEVSFSVTCTSGGVELTGVTVALDGVALGSAPGSFRARPGLHQLRLSREWFAPWEKTVNVTGDQAFNIALEFSEKGLRKFHSVERFSQHLAERKAAVEIATEQSAALAERTVLVGEGEKKKREQSYIRFEGDIDSLRFGEANTPAPATNVNVIR